MKEGNHGGTVLGTEVMDTETGTEGFGAELDGAGTGTEAGTEEGGTGTDVVFSLDQAEVVESIESLRDDLQQATALLEATNSLVAALVFLTLFVWAERKVRNAVMKFTGGKKNAGID